MRPELRQDVTVPDYIRVRTEHLLDVGDSGARKKGAFVDQLCNIVVAGLNNDQELQFPNTSDGRAYRKTQSVLRQGIRVYRDRSKNFKGSPNGGPNGEPNGVPNGCEEQQQTTVRTELLTIKPQNNSPLDVGGRELLRSKGFTEDEIREAEAVADWEQMQRGNPVRFLAGIIRNRRKAEAKPLGKTVIAQAFEQRDYSRVQEELMRRQEAEVIRFLEAEKEHE